MKLKHKIYFAIAAILALASWAIAIYSWGRLPDTIPVHFGISGQADSWADKTIYYVFLVPFIQSLILGFFVFLYCKPQYSDIPTSMWLMTLGKKQRDNAFSLIRIMLAGMPIWLGILLTYITYSMNASSFNADASLASWVIVAVVALMLIWLSFWSVKVYTATKKAVQQK
jgi:hypothetical protein